MKLLFQQEEINYESTPSIDDVIEQINHFLGNDYYFSHLIVDGEEVNEDPEQFLLQNLSSIASLEIVAIEAKEFVNNVLLSAEEYLERATPLIPDLADAFYHNPSKENWLTLNELFEGIQWMASMVATVDQSIVRPENWDAVVEPFDELQENLAVMEEGLENADTVLVADIVQYEILPVFEILTNEIKTAIDTKGIRHDLN